MCAKDLFIVDHEESVVRIQECVSQYIKASEMLDSRACMGTVLFLLDSWLKWDVSTDITVAAVYLFLHETQIFLDRNLFSAKSVPD